MSVTNSVRLIGRLGKDPEKGMTKNNQPKVTFNMGVGRLGSAKDVTDWFFVTMYGKQAETAGNLLRKGALVAVEGSIETWRKQDNSTGFGVAASGWQILEPKKGGSQAGDREADRQEEQERANAALENEDTYPF